MDLNYFVSRLSGNRGVFESLMNSVGIEQVRWKPLPDKWSMLEVINHMYDEEREDFRQRLDLVLTDPAQAWPPIDPRNWVTTRGYNDKDPVMSLNNFLAEREKSLGWLKQLSGRIGRTGTNVRIYPLPPVIFLLPGWPPTSSIFDNWRVFIGSMSARLPILTRQRMRGPGKNLRLQDM